MFRKKNAKFNFTNKFNKNQRNKLAKCSQNRKTSQNYLFNPTFLCEMVLNIEI